MAYRLRIANWDSLYENNRTRDLKNLNWVPIPNRMDGDSYTELVDHPEAAAHYGAWVAMVSIASRQEPRGVLPREGARIPQALARISRLPAELFAALIPRLLDMGWIECFEGVMDDPALGCENPAPSCDITALACVEGKGTEGNERREGTRAPSPKNGSGTAHGSRFDLAELPFEWQEWTARDLFWAAERAERTFATFADYWRAKPGAAGRKTDWLATWRNWCRREDGTPNLNGSNARLFPQKQTGAEQMMALAKKRISEGRSPL